jgi:hypothetical protein
MKIKLKGNQATGQVWLNEKPLFLERSQSIVNHSPDGFQWGYGGSGSSQLALAVLLEVLPEDEAKSRYQQFKWDVIANLPRTDFETEVEI